MPGFDGSGPRGEGPMTGWGMGYCAQPKGEQTPPSAYGGMGIGRWYKWMRGMWPRFGGWGRGRGWGRGWGRGFRGGFGW